MSTAALLCTGALALAALAAPSWAAPSHLSRIAADQQRLAELEAWKAKFIQAGNGGTLKAFQKIHAGILADEDKLTDPSQHPLGFNMATGAFDLGPQAGPQPPRRVPPPRAGKVLYPDTLTTAEKKEQVRAAVKWTWDAYRNHAMGADKLIFHPRATPCAGTKRGGGVCADWGLYGLADGNLSGAKGGAPGATMVDALDVLHLMGFHAELADAREYIAAHLSFDGNVYIDTFEVIIRVLGGLLSAHALTKDALFRDKAIELGDRLLPAIPAGMLPCRSFNLKTKHCDETIKTTTTLGQAGTMALEFRQLGVTSGMSRFTDTAINVENLLIKSAAAQPVPYLLPETLSRSAATPISGDVQVDGGADSYYEYILKLWLQSGKTDTELRAVYDSTVTSLLDTIGHDFPGGTFMGRLTWPLSAPHVGKDYTLLRNRVKPIGGHLSCFFPGMLALGARGRDDANAVRDLKFAAGMMDTCWQFYNMSMSGLGGEYMSVGSKRISITNAQNKLRPEVAESLMVMWRVTKDPEYRRRGWQMFSAFERFAKHKKGGYCAMTAANSLTPMCGSANGDLGGQPSFWLAETLKYLYLLFEDDESAVVRSVGI